MSFLGNRAVNIVNLHFAFKRFASSLFDSFSILFIYQLGVPLQICLFIWASMFVLRLVFRPFALLAQQRLGLKKSVVLGSFFFAGLYPLMLQVQGLDFWLVAFAVYAGLADVLYWLPYHSYFARLGDSEHRGQQLGVREFLALGATTLAPILGGFLIQHYGFGFAFYLATFSALISGFIVLAAPEVSPGQSLTWREAWTEIDKTGLALYTADSFGFNTHIFIWGIVVFLLLGNYQSFGLILGLGVVFQMLGVLLLGRVIDHGNGGRIALIGTVLIAIVAVSRALLGWSVPTIIACDALAALATTFYGPPFNTAIYNSSKHSHNSHWFQFFAESGWDFGSIAALVLAGSLVAAGLPLRVVLFASLCSAGAVFWLLRGYFRRHARLTVSV